MRIFTKGMAVVLLICVGSGCQSNAGEGLSADEAQAYLDGALRMWNEHDPSLADELYAQDVVWRDTGLPQALIGLDAFKGYVRGLFAGFPDLRITFDDTVVEGDQMVIRWAISSTLAGSVRDTVPEGIQVRFSGLSILTFADGKVVEGWDFYHAMDLQDMMLKMGYTVIPPEAGGS